MGEKGGRDGRKRRSYNESDMDGEGEGRERERERESTYTVPLVGSKERACW